MSFPSKRLILLLSITAAFGADKEKPKFESGPVTSYESRQTIGKLTIGARAYESEELAREAFGKLNPYKHGVLPVLVVMQNDGGKALTFDNMRVKYIAPTGEDIEATPPEEVRYLSGPRKPSMTGGTSPIPRFPGSGRKKNPLDAWEILGRAFLARMLPPGESANGFFYFQTGHRKGSRLYVTGIREADTGEELFFFEIPLNQ